MLSATTAAQGMRPERGAWNGATAAEISARAAAARAGAIGSWRVARSWRDAAEVVAVGLGCFEGSVGLEESGIMVSCEEQRRLLVRNRSAAAADQVRLLRWHARRQHPWWIAGGSMAMLVEACRMYVEREMVWVWEYLARSMCKVRKARGAAAAARNSSASPHLLV